MLARYLCSILIFLFCFGKSQVPYKFNLELQDQACGAGYATLKIDPHVLPQDSVKIIWSTGEKDSFIAHGLTEGNYQVEIIVKHPQDSDYVTTDTILVFTIGKSSCPVGVDKYFSPNGDNYHDKMGISYIQLYPNFELTIYNKWGQRVHHQEKDYEPWDGTWAGVNLPDGTYYYIFFYDANDKSNVEKGDVTILR
ncbi:MAG: gliding motility-associated C-terminal domain-containing protein [Bacteroidia bacterium]|nr:gliding motility-associated C-terminal domain-containing protein [Bacteroidia bacterium]